MIQQPQLATEQLAGDIQPLIEQIGSPSGLTALAGSTGKLSLQKIASVADLRNFLEYHQTQILAVHELPAINHAFGHAMRNELREMVEYDAQLAGEPLLKNFSSASRLVGLMQLQRLRPLHDHRLVKRYLAAVERGDAQGWHTLVYGLMLAVYSLPLRQGLLDYAQQTTQAFIRSASHTVKFSGTDARELLEHFSARLPATVDAVVGKSVLS